jgi:hypothetical protein
MRRHQPERPETMTISIEVRTAVHELDALNELGIAMQHAHSMATISAIENAVAVISDRAAGKGATIDEIYEGYTTGRRGLTYLKADRDEQLVTAHLARALVYLDDTDLASMLAVAAAIAPAVTADTAAA